MEAFSLAGGGIGEPALNVRVYTYTPGDSTEDLVSPYSECVISRPCREEDCTSLKSSFGNDFLADQGLTGGKFFTLEKGSSLAIDTRNKSMFWSEATLSASMARPRILLNSLVLLP